MHSENLSTNVNAHFSLLMAAKWKFLKFGICKKFQWNFVYFWSMNYYYGCMSLLFWKGRLSELDFMLSRPSAHLSRACVVVVPRNAIALQNSGRVQLLPRVFLHLDPCSIHLHTEALWGTLSRALRLSHPLCMWIQQIVLHTSLRKKYYSFVREEVNFKQWVNKNP